MRNNVECKNGRPSGLEPYEIVRGYASRLVGARIAMDKLELSPEERASMVREMVINVWDSIFDGRARIEGKTVVPLEAESTLG